MLTLLAPLVLVQSPPKPPRTPQRDKRYGWGRGNRAGVVVNGKSVGGSAIIRDNRIQVPIRVIFQALGANVAWYPENMKVVALTRTKTISMIIGENTAYDPDPVMLDYPPMLMRGTVYVPLKFVAQTLGAKVRFNRKTKTAYVDLPMDSRASGTL